MRNLVIGAALMLSGCAIGPATDLSSSLYGRHLDTLSALYGPWSETLTLDGRPLYVWRRMVQVDGGEHYCEIWVETGFRKAISRRTMQGYAPACQQFALREATTSSVTGLSKVSD
ncbi:hypothetical protein [Phenylobacterium sp.]|uniref:hypothetical protein n=1 Tax=Phenylobacterium sp. TaxID=1871053 RepID=UPI003983B323